MHPLRKQPRVKPACCTRRGSRNPRQPISSPSARAVLLITPNTAYIGIARKIAVARGQLANPNASPNGSAKVENANEPEIAAQATTYTGSAYTMGITYAHATYRAGRQFQPRVAKSIPNSAQVAKAAKAGHHITNE